MAPDSSFTSGDTFGSLICRPVSIFSTCCFTASPPLLATRIPALLSFSFGSTFSAFLILSASLALATPTSWGWGGCALCILGFSCSWSRAVWLEAGGDLIFSKGAVASGGTRQSNSHTNMSTTFHAPEWSAIVCTQHTFCLSLSFLLRHISTVCVCVCVHRITVRGILSMLCELEYVAVTHACMRSHMAGS